MEIKAHIVRSKVSNRINMPTLGWTTLIFCAALLPRITNLGVFLAHDETLFWEWSRQFFFSLLAGDFKGTIVGPGNPSIIPMWAQVIVMGVQYGWAWLNGVQATALAEWPAFQPHLVFAELPWRRLPVVLTNTLSVTAIWWLCERLFGRKLALLAAALIILDPFILADSRTGRGEGLLTGFVTVALLSFIAFWHSRQQRYLIISGLVTGLALLTKLSALSLVPTVGLITLGTIWPTSELTAGDKIRKTATVLLIWSGIALATFWALWPAMWVAPGAALEFLWGFAHNVGVEGRTNYFFGRLYEAEFLPLYYPVVFILRVTPVALAGLAAFAALLYVTMSRRYRSGLSWVDAWAEATHGAIGEPVLWVAAYALIFGMFMTVGVLKRDWYLMPAFPALDIVAAAGLLWAGQILHQRFWPGLDALRLGVAGLALVVLLQGTVSLASHPLYYTYWNPLVGGGRWAADAIMVGWDLDLGMGAHYLNEKPDASDLKVAVRSMRGFQEIFDGTTLPLEIDSNWVQADYLLVRRTHLQLAKHDPWELNYFAHLELDHVITIGGVDYLWIYRGPGAGYFAGPSQLEGKGTLFGYDLSTTTASVGQTLHLVLYWLDRGVTPEDAFFVRLTDLGGDVWAETTAQPRPEFANHRSGEATITESIADLAIPVGTPPGRYFLQMGFYSRARAEEIGQFSLPAAGQTIELVPTAQRFNPPPVSHAINQPAGPGLTLLGYDLPAGDLSQSDPNRVWLVWQAQAKIDQDFATGLQLLDNNHREVAYWLGRPVKSGYRTDQWQAGEIVKDPWDLDIPPEIAPDEYTLRLTLYDSANSEAVGEIDLGPVTVTDRRRIYELPALQQRLDARLGKAISLKGYDLFQEPLTGGARFVLKLYWQADQPIAQDYTVFTQVLGPDGTVVGQHDGRPAGDTLPTPMWDVGEIIPDRHLIDFPTLQSGTYRLIVGMYDSTSGTRLPIQDLTGAPLGDYIQLDTVNVE